MALLPASNTKPAPWWRSPRLPAAIVVALVHVGIISIILTSQPGAIALPPVPHEMFYLFPPAPPLVRLPHRIEPPVAAHRTRPLFRYEPSTGITLPAPVESALEQSLFGCAPEDLSKLTPAQRAHCGEVYSARAYDGSLQGPPQPLDTARWQTDIDSRNTPPSMACTGAASTPARAPNSASTATLVDPLCLLRSFSSLPAQ
ncbi:MAG TPA: hypothetical protein VJ476_02840 [Rhizomicrobium sp.]|nr:hypothetical protein [Rhizomicrobium sp.]